MSANFGIFQSSVTQDTADRYMDKSASYADGQIANSTITVTAPSTWVQFTGGIFSVTSPSKNVDIEADQMRIKRKGRYKVTLTANVQIVAGAFVPRTVELGTCINGADPTVGISLLSTLGSLTPGTATGINLIDLNIGDVLGVCGRNLTDAEDIEILSGDLVVERIDI